MTLEEARKIAIDYVDCDNLVITNESKNNEHFAFLFDYPNVDVPTP